MLRDVNNSIDSKLGQSHVFSLSAKALLVSVIPALKELSDRGELTISKDEISKYTQFSEFHKLAESGYISNDSKSILMSYLHSRACYDLTLPAEKQPEEVTRPWNLTHGILVEALQSVNEDKWIE